MKYVDGKVYLRIGEAATIVNRTNSTIKNWYGWAEENDKVDILPEMIRIGERKDRYFLESDMDKLKNFANSIKYGSMSKFNEKLWGQRNIENKRSTEFKLNK